jgi:hypothetical protein
VLTVSVVLLLAAAVWSAVRLRGDRRTRTPWSIILKLSPTTLVVVGAYGAVQAFKRGDLRIDLHPHAKRADPR